MTFAKCRFAKRNFYQLNFSIFKGQLQLSTIGINMYGE